MAASIAGSVETTKVQQYTLWGDKWEFNEGRYVLSGINRLASFKNSSGLQRALSRTPTSKVPLGCSLHIFKQGILPVYDHPRNAAGGHFKLQAVNVRVADEIWAQFAEALVTGVFPYEAEVNGITYMKKQHIRGIKIWVSNSLDKELVADVKKYIQAQMQPQQFINFKFCPHKYILQTLLKQSRGMGSVPNNSMSLRRNRGPQRSGWDMEMRGWDMETAAWDEQCAAWAHGAWGQGVNPWEQCPSGHMEGYAAAAPDGPEEEGEEEEENAEDGNENEQGAEAENKSASGHSDSDSVGDTSDGKLSKVSPSASSAFSERMDSETLSEASTFGSQYCPMYFPYGAANPPPKFATPVTAPPAAQVPGRVLTPLMRLRHKFSQRHGNCPFPTAPVAYMTHILVQDTQFGPETC